MTISINTYQRVWDLLPCTARSRELIEIAAPVARFSNHWEHADSACYLPLSLRFLHRLALAKTPKVCGRFLSTRSLSLGNFFISPISYSPPLSRLNEDQRRSLIPPPVNADVNDSGPKDAWYWAHAESSYMWWYDHPFRDGLRKWAYVMWDSTRLRDWGVLDRDHSLLPRRTEDKQFWEAIAKALREHDAKKLSDCSGN